jgi:hypothetical protein
VVTTISYKDDHLEGDTRPALGSSLTRNILSGLADKKNAAMSFGTTLRR